MVAAALINLERAFDSVWIIGLLYELINYNFPIHLINIIWSMVNGESFVLWDGNETTNTTFQIKEGLQQGTVTSPILFNIFNADIINLFDLNNNNDTHFVAFGDDLLVYVAGKSPLEIKIELENLVNKINTTYQVWNLRINPAKCETILFSKPVHYLSKK